MSQWMQQPQVSGGDEILGGIAPEPARELFEEELRSPEYQRQFSGPVREFIDNVIDWLNSARLSVGEMSIPFGPLILLALLVVAVVLTVVLVRPRLQQGSEAEPLLDIDPSASAEQLRQRAAVLYGQGNFSQAGQDWLRALVREAEEQGAVPAMGSSTATEAAATISSSFPDFTGQLRRAAAEFNASLYGTAQLNQGQAEAMAQLDEQLRQVTRAKTAASHTADPKGTPSGSSLEVPR